MLTRKMRDTLVFIQDFQEQHNGASPNLEEIRRHLRAVSKGAAHGIVSRLVDRGQIKLVSNGYGKPSSIEVLKPIVSRKEYFVWRNGRLVPFSRDGEGTKAAAAPT
jgi:SOS-response transcriptional repressor LexA